ncbi:MAG TPA: FtsX-like permease family protein, partial [Vicinamibacterales bacterium]|nr:FtsX-like permease family protein [Vicinamibacterales bacterium]
EASSPLWVTLAAAALVLVLGGANVTNLFLIRSEQRAREVGISRALGATSRHLFATLLAEAALIAAAAGTIAVPIAMFALNLVLARARGLLPRLDAVAIDAAALAGLALVAALTALLLAAAGLWRSRGVTLRETARGSSAAPARTHVRLVLSSLQVALAFALVVTATLLVRSVWNLVHLDKGFSADRALTFEIALPYRGYETFRKNADYHRTLLERLRMLPGVEAAGAVSDLPLSGFTLKRFLDSFVFVERPGQAPLEVNGVNWKLATPGYFDAMRIPVLNGRWVRPDEHFDDTFPIVVSDGFARRHLGASPLGQRIRHYADPHWWTVIGVVGDVRDDGLRATPADAAYAPVLDQEKGAPFTAGSLTHVVRTSVPPESVVPSVRAAVAALDSRVPLAEMQTMDAVVSRSMARDALVLALVTVAAGLAIVMGVVGLYGALAYSIAQQRRELGIRLALGATAGRLRRDVTRVPAVAIVAGVLTGTILAWLSGRLLAGLLFGVEAGDAATYAASATILLATCAVAVALSLRGLRRVSPLEALRSE